MVTVQEEWVAIAILRCLEMEKAIVEGGGASGVAAVLAGLCPELKGKKYTTIKYFFLKLIQNKNVNLILFKKHSTSNQNIFSRVVIPLCGGNIDTTILGRCLDRGLAADGRLVKFSCTISDRPGGMAELLRLDLFYWQIINHFVF